MQPEFLAVITTYFSFQEQNQNIGCKLPSTVTSASALILIFTSITPHIYCTPGDLVFHRGQLCCWRFGQWGVEEGGSALPIRLSTPPFWKSEGTQTEWITGSREWWEANVWMNLIETHLWRTPPSPVWTSDLFMRLRGHMLQCKGQRTPCSSQRRHSWYILCTYEYAGNISNNIISNRHLLYTGHG